MLMYHDIIKTHKFKHIIKLHTKSKKEYHNLVEYLLSVPLTELINDKSKPISEHFALAKQMGHSSNLQLHYLRNLKKIE